MLRTLAASGLHRSRAKRGGRQGTVQGHGHIAEPREAASGRQNARLARLGWLRVLTGGGAHVDREDQLVTFDFALDSHGVPLSRDEGRAVLAGLQPWRVGPMTRFRGSSYAIHA